MNQKNKLHIEFGTSETGWIRTNLSFIDYKLELDISSILSNPMIQLCDSLIQINKGINTPDRIIWYLEPHCYYLQLIKNNKGYSLIILESKEYNSSTKITKEINGDFETIILPMYRAIKKFYTQTTNSGYLGELEFERIKELTLLVKSKKEIISSSTISKKL